MVVSPDEQQHNRSKFTFVSQFHLRFLAADVPASSVRARFVWVLVWVTLFTSLDPFNDGEGSELSIMQHTTVLMSMTAIFHPQQFADALPHQTSAIMTRSRPFLPGF